MAQTDKYVLNLTDPLKTAFAVNAYTSNGNILPTSTTLAPQSVDAKTSLLFIGKGFPDYGEQVQENILHILENFAGATEPTNPIEGQVWFSTALYWYNTASTSWFRWNSTTSLWDSITVSLTASLLPAEGDYWFDGTYLYRWNANLGGWKKRTFSQYAADPTSSDFPLKLLKVYTGAQWKTIGSAITSSVEPNGNVNIGDLWLDTSSGTQLRVWDGSLWNSVADNYVLKSGDTMTGLLTLSGDPTSALHATTKQYVDNNFIGVAGGTMTGLLTLSGDPITNLQAATKQYVDSVTSTAALNDLTDVIITSPTANQVLVYTPGSPGQWVNQTAPYVPLSGGTMTGPLTLQADPITALQAATKQYVDAFVSSANTYVSSVSFNSSTHSLTLTRNDAVTLVASGIAPSIHTHFTADILHYEPTTSTPLSQFTSVPSTAFGAIRALEAYTTRRTSPTRSVITTSVPTTTVTVPSYEVGTDKLMVFVNGVKQIASFMGYQPVNLNAANLLLVSDIDYPCEITGLPNDTTELVAEISIDGGASQLISIPGQDAQDYCALISQINAQLVGGTATYFDGYIVVYSDTHGSSSSVSIVDGVSGSPAVGSPPTVSIPLFGALTEFVSIGTAVSGSDFSYEEVGAYGTTSTTIQFLSSLSSGVTIEAVVLGSSGIL